MSLTTAANTVACLSLLAFSGSPPQEPSPQEPSPKQKARAVAAAQRKVLASMAGQWEGTCRTWFQPGQLADESKVSGTFALILGDRFLRHTYKGSMKGKPRTGEETLVFNPARGEFEVTWIDDFHMNYGILFSRGKPVKSGFSVTGKYDIGPGQPPWGWKTTYEIVDKDHLTITAYNILPDGREAKAVETRYVRSGK